MSIKSVHAQRLGLEETNCSGASESDRNTFASFHHRGDVDERSDIRGHIIGLECSLSRMLEMTAVAAEVGCFHSSVSRRLFIKYGEAYCIHEGVLDLPAVAKL